MNKNEMNHFGITFDFSTVDYENVWEAMAGTLAESVQSEDAIVSAKHLGIAPNGWPMLYIIFASIECARAFTYAYLGCTLGKDEWDASADAEVEEYIREGAYVNG